jgi:hypothetical protein
MLKNVPPTSTAICSAGPVTINQINTPHNPYVSLMPSSKWSPASLYQAFGQHTSFPEHGDFNEHNIPTIGVLACWKPLVSLRQLFRRVPCMGAV